MQYASSSDVGSLITATGATVTANQTFNDHTLKADGVTDANQDVTGLGVVASTGYTASFNTTFSGDLELEYVFPDADQTKATIDNTRATLTDGVNGDFMITITNVDDPTQKIELIYYPFNDGTSDKGENNLLMSAKYYSDGNVYQRARMSKTNCHYYSRKYFCGRYVVACSYYQNSQGKACKTYS